MKDNFEDNQNKFDDYSKINVGDEITSRDVYPNKKPSLFRNKYIALGLSILVGTSSLGVSLGYGYGLATKSSIQENKISANVGNYEELNVNNNRFLLSSTADSNTVSIVKNASNSVVSISVSSTTNYYNRVLEQPSAGSGIIFYEDKEKVFILTNNHVIESANKVYISIDDTKSVPASYVGSDSSSDLAVISVTKADLKNADITNYGVARFGNSDKLEVGETVVAIGNALGEGKTATKGIVSALNKQLVIDGRVLNVLQTDAAINPGNSGGALVNSSSEVIGINTAKLSDYDVEGMGYSIPSNTAKAITDEIMKNGSIERPYLGIVGGTVTEEMKAMYNLPSFGVYISGVASKSSAALAGLKTGDMIIGFNGVTITTMEQLSELISKTSVGDKVKLDILKVSRTPATIEVTIMDANKTSGF